MNTARFILVATFFAVSLVAQQPGSSRASSHMSNFTLASPAFPSGAAIPDRYTCKGADDSPLLAWTGPPPQAVTFALTSNPGGKFVIDG